LLFSVSGEKGLTADYAAGQAEPIFSSNGGTVADGAVGKGMHFDDLVVQAWSAPGNIYAQRGTVSFFFRASTPVGTNPFPIFRVGSDDGTSWDMQFLRIDWNGHGFDAFVTDNNLARSRVSFTVDKVPTAGDWTHITFAWDETTGVRLWVNGRPAARKDIKAVYDQGLFGFGPFQRIVSSWQVSSQYNYKRGGDIDELRIYDHMLSDAEVAALAAKQTPAVAPVNTALSDPAIRDAWYQRFGWNRPDDVPAYLSDPVTEIRKVEFAKTMDLKEKSFKGADGIRETTWPGVYNRSKLPGRHDYFELPDWNTYAVGGNNYTLTLPDEPWNRIEIQGAAYGKLTRVSGDGAKGATLLTRPQGQDRTSTQLAQTLHGGVISFDNAVQETPIEEIGAYYVAPGKVPTELATLSYTVDASADITEYPALDGLRGEIAGRNIPAERATVVALPRGAPRDGVAASTSTKLLPIVHVLIPGDFRTTHPGGEPGKFSYGWKNMGGGLDGVVLEIPALKVEATHKGLLPLNIRIKDPNWPERDLLDVNVSVKPGEARTLWLDTRDRILDDNANIYLTIAAAGGGFDAASLNGMNVKLVFKKATDAKAEHVADRLEQARDNLANLVEEQPNTRSYPIWDRFERDITDVLSVDPDNAVARSYWVEKNPEQPYAPFTQTPAPAGVPLWAFRQSQDLKLYRKFVDWWIDNRQLDNGEFGGGLSDDTDLVNQWVSLAAMGVEPDRLIASQRKVVDATFANGMWTNGLSTIRADELHSYEDGINAVAQSMQINWGDPTAIERGMAVARNYPRLTQVNAAGHLHFVSAYFSGADIVREGTWGWQRQYSFLVTHPGLLLVDYNGDPQTRKIVLGLLDGWLAHGKQDASGNWSFPGEIEWSTDKTRDSGVGSASNVFWAAYTWTGDEKYLRPISRSLGGAGSMNADLVARLPGGIEANGRPTGAAVDRNTGGSGDREFGSFVRWQKSGDKAILADLYGKEIETNSQRMNILTEAHLWSDRVSVPSDLLQRARLGGVAHRRNAYYPGNVVNWRFAGGEGDDVAILIPEGDPKHFRVIAYNLSDKPMDATMTGAQLDGGTWTMKGGVDADNDDKPDAGTPESSIVLERGRGVHIALPPHQTVAYEFTLKKPGDDPATRADIGLSGDDLTLKGRKLSIRVHSLGAKGTPAGTATLEDNAGKAVATVRFPALAAPADLQPKTADISVSVPAGVDAAHVRVRLSLDGKPAEVTDANNVAQVGVTVAMNGKPE
jgi:hypothetical protein